MKDIEAMTIDFLREHDKDYFHKTGPKSKMLEYPYNSDNQEKHIKRHEIPLSNLTNNQRLQCIIFGDMHDFDD